MIVVTTPTGNLGKQVLENLLKREEPIRVITRDASKIPSAIRTQMEIIEGSHSDLTVVTKALQGADSLFWLVPDDAGTAILEDAYVNFTTPACEAIKRTGVKRVVYVTALGRGWKQDAGLATASLKASDLLAATGVHLRTLMMPSFMDNLLSQAGTIKETGVLSWPTQPDHKVPAVASKDIAAVASKLLLDHMWTGQEDVPVLGPEDLSMNDMARVMTEVLGIQVRFEETPIEEFERQMASYGFSEAMVRGYGRMMSAKKEGIDNMVPRTPQTTTPTTFKEWCEENLRPALELSEV